jgi:hypothetical protein
MNGPERLSDGEVLRRARRYSGVHWREPDPAAYEEDPVGEIQKAVKARRRKLSCIDHAPHKVSDQLLGPLSQIIK